MPARIQQRPAIVRAALGGLVAGIVAGIVLAVFLVGLSAIQGRDIWVVVKFAGAPLLHERALEPGFDLFPVLVGALVHFAVSIFWGLMFGLFVYGTTKLWTLLLGAAWGIVVWVGMYYVGLPLVGLNSLARAVPIWMAVTEHVVFGLALAVAFLPFQRARGREHRRPAGSEPINL
jgi:hypothetical protein